MFSANDFIPTPYSHSVESGSFQWSAPSNIALVKYWGKKDKQIPANPSVSFTLNNCKTFTTLAFAKKKHFDCAHCDPFRFLFRFAVRRKTERRFQTKNSTIFRKNFGLFAFSKRLSFYDRH